MPLVVHGLIALTYLALAAAAGIALAGVGLGVEPSLAVGGAMALGGGFVHQVAARVRRDRVFAESLQGVRASQHNLAEALAASREEVRALITAFDEAARNLPGRSCREVASEMRMLETLVRQLSPDGDAGPASLPPPAPASAGSAPPPEGDTDAALDAVRDALRDDRVDVYLQPVVSLPQRKARFYETFSRLRCTDGSLIEPAAYLAVAERAGLVSAIDNNLLFRSIQLVRKVQRRNLNVAFFCNISPYTLGDSTFFPEFIEFMESNPQLAANLIFEFAQASLTRHDERIARNLDRLNAMGFRFSVDRVENLDLDLGELASRHVSFVKIDAATMVERLGDAEGTIEIHRLARTLDSAGISLIAEKIEEEQQVVELLDLGIDFGQGYLFGSPRLSRSGD